MFVSGRGFFTDAYDLLIIGVVMAMTKPEWHPTALQASLVTSTALLASAVGAILFGRIADLLGRKRIYGYEVLVLAAGAIAWPSRPTSPGSSSSASSSASASVATTPSAPPS